MANPATLEACDPTGSLGLHVELGTIKQAARRGISAGRTGSNDTAWHTWTEFCCSLHQDPWLSTIDDPLPILQIFAHRYRLGQLALSGSPVKARTVEGALRAVGQTFAALGYDDPRLQPSGRLDFRLQRQLQCYNKVDPPPTRVKPIPLQVLHLAITHCYRSNTIESQTIAQMLILGFFFLLRPGEYAHTSNEDASPFRLCDIHLMVHTRRLNPYTCSEIDLDATTYIGLEFTTQKNGVRGEIVGLGRSGHHVLCPVCAMINRVKHLRAFRAPTTTPIYSYHNNIKWQPINTTVLTLHLRWAVAALSHEVGIAPEEVSIRSLRASGAMALLCAEVDTDKIRLLGRWRSDEMLRYLHVQAFPVLAPMASLMLRHGYFTLLPNHPLG